MMQRTHRLTDQPAGRLGHRSPTCLIACRDSKLGLAVGKQLEKEHFPMILLSSEDGLEAPLLMAHDVAIVDLPMWRELARVGTSRAIELVSSRPMILLGDFPAGTPRAAGLKPALSLPPEAVPKGLIHAIHALAKSKPADQPVILAEGRAETHEPHSSSSP